MKKGYQIVIGAAVALALVGGGLAGRAMYVEHQRNQAAAEHAKQEKLMKIIYAEADAFAKNGPDEASLNKVKEYMLKKHNEDLKENGYWLNSIDEYLYTGIDPVKDYEQIVNSITAKDVRQFANELLKQQNQITVSMISPEKK